MLVTVDQGGTLFLTLGEEARENVDEAQILAALEPLIVVYAEQRRTGERFGDFLVRAGVVAVDDSGSRTLPLELVA